VVNGGLKIVVNGALARACRNNGSMVDWRRRDAMKLYDTERAPSPRRVRIFLAEKGIEVPRVPVDLAKLEQYGEAFTEMNPMQRVPVLVLDDGSALTETMAICRYFETLQPEPNLFGRSAVETALVEMWSRRIELHFYWPVSQAFRHLHPAMASREKPQVADWGEANRPKAMEFLGLFEKELGKRAYAACDRFTVADITGYVAVDFMRVAKLQVPEDYTNVRRWHAEIAARPSAKA
jgi:glutathione S-transferase